MSDLKYVAVIVGILVGAMLLFGGAALVSSTVHHNQQIECIEVGGSMNKDNVCVK